MRRRYSVVVRGVGGTVRDQTSEISRHRSEAAAREAAETERHRLFVVRPEEALNYRIAILRDDHEVILDEPAVTDETAPLPQGPERDLSSLIGLPPRPMEPGGGNGAAPQDGDTGRVAVPGAGDDGDTGRVPVPRADGGTGPAASPGREGDTGRAPAARRRIEDEPLPDGPVPEDVIARFAESVAREERRRGRRP